MKIYHKTFFWEKLKKEDNLFPTGSRVYKGFQGSGKTYSMVFYALEILEKFPKALLISNIKITTDDTRFIYFSDEKDLKKLLNLSNGKNGILFLLDEAHLFFNKKSGFSLDLLTAISQQRKDRKRIVFSSQIWEELDISLRKQVKEIVTCKSFLNFQINTISDGETLSYDKMKSEYVAKKIRTEIMKRSQYIASYYDTYQKIFTNEEYHRDVALAPAQAHIDISSVKGRR